MVHVDHPLDNVALFLVVPSANFDVPMVRAFYPPAQHTTLALQLTPLPLNAGLVTCGAKMVLAVATGVSMVGTVIVSVLSTMDAG